MEGFDEEGDFMGANDVVVEEEEVPEDGHPYGFDAAPSPMDGSSGSPMQSPAVYGYGGSPLPFDEAAAADNEDIFTEAPGGGPLLPDPGEMREEGTAFRDWRRQNAIYLEEKEKKEKELRNQIIAEAEEYKRKFFEKSTQNAETNKAQNREREKLYHTQQEKFHKEADQHFWKAVAEIIPREVANFEKRRTGRKEDDKKPSVNVIQGPKPGKPTDMTRMRQILAKLKTNPPPHMMPPPPPEKKDSNDGKDSKDGKPATTPKASKDDKSDAAATPKAGGKPVSTPKGTTPKKGKPDEAAGTDEKEKEKKETPVVVA